MPLPRAQLGTAAVVGRGWNGKGGHLPLSTEGKGVGREESYLFEELLQKVPAAASMATERMLYDAVQVAAPAPPFPKN